ncbi:MAG: right-handed parallel beta-helix repeat-containing protein [Verrucomicrobiota bacterium]
MRFTALLFFIWIAAGARSSGQVPLQQWIDEAIKAGGGVVSVPPGEHELPLGLLIKDAKKLALRGLEKERCILKLPRLAYAECAGAAVKGAAEIPVRAARGWKAGMRLHIEADGELDSFTKKPKPFVIAHIREVKEGVLMLKEALVFPVPEGAVIRDADAPNLIEIRGACEDLEIANLTLDGGRTADDSPVQGHAQLCAVFASGAYDYEKGPTGPKPKGVVVRDCIIQNCFGRGVAFYSVEKPEVLRCSFRDGCDEAVDFDHFTTGGKAIGNQIARCRIAFEMNDVNECLVEGNEARDCSIGVSLWRWCKQPGLNEANVIRNNSFVNTTGNAFQIGTGTARNLFEANEVDGAGRNGFSLSGSAQVLRGNVVRGAKLKEIVTNEGEHDIQPAVAK